MTGHQEIVPVFATRRHVLFHFSHNHANFMIKCVAISIILCRHSIIMRSMYLAQFYLCTCMEIGVYTCRYIYPLVSKSHQSQLLLSTNSVTRCLWVTHTNKLIYSIQQPLSILIVSIYAALMIPIESGWTRHNVLIIPIFIILFCM